MKVTYSEDRKTAFFDGYKFRQDVKTGYYLANKPTYQGRRERLHVYVWRYFNGFIPEGYHVHHRDEDKSNNDIENLECIPRFNHLSLHGKERSEKFHDEIVKNLVEKAVPRASEWHKSEAGRAWHRENGFPVWKMEEAEHVCEYCGKAYMTRGNGHDRFCSNNCKSAARRKSGVDNETRKCVFCGKEFITSKYSKAKTCSRPCRNLLRSAGVSQANRQATSL